MKKLHIVLFIALFILCAVSNSYAYQSLWDRIEYGQEEGESIIQILTNEDLLSTSETGPFEIPVLNEDRNYGTEIYLKVDSLQLFGDTDESIQTLLQLIHGLGFTLNTQAGDIPMQAFSIDLAGKEFFSYKGQLTTPYYVSSNFLVNRHI